MSVYSIQSAIEATEWWSNELGWISHPGRTIFTSDERDSLNLPMGGKWVEEPTVDPQGEFANEFPDEHSHDPQQVDEDVYGGLHVTDEEGRHYYLQIKIEHEGLVIEVFDRYGEQCHATFARTYNELLEFVFANDPLNAT